MDIYALAWRLALLAEEEEEGLKGLFNGPQRVIGVILAGIGLMTVYVGFKVRAGYKLLPEPQTAVPQEDGYIAARAKVLQKKKHPIEGTDKSDPEYYIEWKIGYEVEGEKYTQFIGEGDYTKGDFIDIKYDPQDPRRFYLVDEPEEPDEDEEDEEPEAPPKNNNGLLIAVLGLIVAAVGVILII